jgi:flagellar biosynthesis/type III secretory pathway chaperone|tara:strand:+ start:43 stop:501 length:459 start_codon:yes stop_codon:yes gene_type:complete
MSYPQDQPHPEAGASLDALTALASELLAHVTLCEEIFTVVQQEHQKLRTSSVDDLAPLQAGRQGILDRLNTAQEGIRTHKAAWTRLQPSERQQRPDIANLLKQSTDLIMKIVSLDRENEQLMLRNKLVPPSHLPPAQRQNPNLVAKMYKDQP